MCWSKKLKGREGACKLLFNHSVSVTFLYIGISFHFFISFSYFQTEKTGSVFQLWIPEGFHLWFVDVSSDYENFVPDISNKLPQVGRRHLTREQYLFPIYRQSTSTRQIRHCLVWLGRKRVSRRKGIFTTHACVLCESITFIN